MHLTAATGVPGILESATRCDGRLASANPRAHDNGSAAHHALAAASVQVFTYFAGLMHSRRAAPGDDVVSVLVRPRLAGEPVRSASTFLNGYDRLSVVLTPAG